MGHRLQTVTGSGNWRCFKPHTEWEVLDYEGEFDSQESMEQCLMNACRENGYRKLDVDTCVFKKLLRSKRPLLMNTIAQPLEETLAELDTAQGEMSLTEVNVCDNDGEMRTWLWFRAIKPMITTSGEAPDCIASLPDSVFMFAVPTLQVALVEDC